MKRTLIKNAIIVNEGLQVPGSVIIEGEKIADRYEVTWSSLFVNRWKDGQEQRNNMTEFAFSKATSDPEGFKAGLKEKIEILMK